jgi:hypothetical protein
MSISVLATFGRRAAIAGGAAALAALAFAAPGSAQAAAPAADTPVPVCLDITVVDLVSTGDQLCGGK